MSVINQMLKDLGERQTRSEWRLADMLDRESPSIKLTRNHRAVSALLVLGGALALGIVAWLQWRHPAQSAAPIPANARQTSMVAQAAVINSIGIQADGESLRLVLESDKAPAGGAAQVFNADGSIDYTLANSRIEAALPVLADNPFIKSYALSQHGADVVLRVVPAPNAQGFIEPAATGDGYRTVIGARVRHAGRLAAVPKMEQAATPTIEKPGIEKTAHTPKTQAATAHSAPAQARSADAAGTERMQITRSVTSSGQADTYYRQALQELQADRIGAAQSDLRKAVNLQPDMHAARELLAALLLRSGQSAEAYAELQRGMQLDPAYTAYARLYAQSLIEAGDPAGALRVLEVSAPYAGQQADYRALMAAVTQRLGKHEESVRHYMAALALKSSRSGWWVGMAISLEALGRTQEAVQAYRTALAGSELNPDLMNYARARVAQLGDQSGGTGAGG
ncbi:MAG TPA: tetratricopeptide repeat protein [Gammaproteobacteria bacterium]|nr:tetratricopeptide repeat protein [Gammaproteobacteria bacterium]